MTDATDPAQLAQHLVSELERLLARVAELEDQNARLRAMLADALGADGLGADGLTVSTPPLTAAEPTDRP